MVTELSTLPGHATGPAAGEHGLTAIILDDNEVDRMRLRKLCQRAGLQLLVSEAANLSEFRQALERQEYDLVFIDYHLGMETGLEALSDLTAHPDQVDAIPIMVTSFNQCDIAVAAMREGCADFLVKEELSIDQIRYAVAHAMERRVLLSAVSQSRTMQGALKTVLQRFGRSCGPELRTILAGLLRQARALRRRETLDGDLRSRLTLLERGCTDVVICLDDLATLVETLETAAADPRKPPRLS